MEKKCVLFFDQLKNDAVLRGKFENVESLEQAFNIAKPLLGVTFEMFQNFLVFVSDKTSNDFKYLDDNELDSIVGDAGLQEFINCFGARKNISLLVLTAFLTLGSMSTAFAMQPSNPTLSTESIYVQQQQESEKVKPTSILKKHIESIDNASTQNDIDLDSKPLNDLNDDQLLDELVEEISKPNNDLYGEILGSLIDNIIAKKRQLEELEQKQQKLSDQGLPIGRVQTAIKYHNNVSKDVVDILLKIRLEKKYQLRRQQVFPKKIAFKDIVQVSDGTEQKLNGDHKKLTHNIFLKNTTTYITHKHLSTSEESIFEKLKKYKKDKSDYMALFLTDGYFEFFSSYQQALQERISEIKSICEKYDFLDTLEMEFWKNEQILVNKEFKVIFIF